ncbi:hypothetical protein PV08_10690 [Exophiala spinifera]|uniref:F-box domain-containing protein n=1 Tax=Exophiala spinifera TaxID=91928 RepID=A0A0D2AYA8_9EURO|nr:uncharacterized protein PV08_10690 [Exophiala spinifera]KIW11390.1 hypothetical protein PV08_10690 [Exophiala spinifera]
MEDLLINKLNSLSIEMKNITTTTTTTTTVVHVDNSNANIFHLPTEILTEIISFALDSIDLCCSGAMKFTPYLEKPRPILDLQLTCKRFHCISLQALSKRGHVTVNLVGPVPIKDRESMKQVHKYYTSLLMAHFQPAIEKQRRQVLINLLPELNSQYPPAGINWAPCDPKCPPRADKDDATVRRVMVSHQAAAILVSGIMRSISLKHPGLRLRIAVHDVDWMCPDYRHPPAEDSQQRPRIIPFWDLTGVCGVVYHWRWLRVYCGEHNEFSDVFTTSTIAVAVNTHLRMAWDNYVPAKSAVITALSAGGTALAHHVFQASLTKLMNTWVGGPMAEWSRTTVASPVRVYIPGYQEKVVCAENMTFAQWLTTICANSLYTKCFALRGVGARQVAGPTEMALELDEPGGRTLMLHGCCR